MKNCRNAEKFKRKTVNSCLSLSTVTERSNLEIIVWSNFFACFLGLNSSVVGLVIDFSTSGLGFVKYC